MSLSQPTNNVTPQQVGEAVRSAVGRSTHAVFQTVQIGIDSSRIVRDKWDWIVPVSIDGGDVSVKSFELHQALEEVQLAAGDEVGESIFLQIEH